jgi:FkbM family methyltransferase
MNTEKLYHELEKQYFSEDMQEQAEIALLPKLLQGVQLFVDVGASIGQYSYHAGKNLRKSKIVAIEADPVRYTKLRDLTSIWQTSSDNSYEVLHAAVSNETGMISFYVTGESLCGGLFKYWKPEDPSLQDKVNWTAVEVPAITLDSLFPNGDPDLVKVDVEGAEYRVIEGANKIVARGHTRFLVEIHPWGDESYGKRPSDVFAYFTNNGYRFSRTHTHWLFERSEKITMVNRFKSFLVGFILDHESIKKVVKAVVLKFNPKRFLK